MNLIVQAKSEEALEEQAWYSMHPDWIIKYDVYYNGPEHIITEDNIQYGFRHKTKENGDI
jgi:hypothetical protein